MSTKNLADNKSAARNYGLDLLKILCMFCVIGFHFVDHGGVKLCAALPLSFNWSVLAFFSLFGGITNCVFMLVSGYFLMGKRFKIRNLLRLYGQVWFFSVLSGALVYMVRPDTLLGWDILSMLLPFTHNEYWYFTSYIIVYLMFPYLNAIVEKLNPTQHKALILGGIGLITLLRLDELVVWVQYDNKLPLFIVMYFVGAYIRKYNVSLPRNKVAVWTLVMFVMEIASIFLMRVLTPTSERFEDSTYFVYDSTKLMPIVTSVLLFLLFKDIKLKGGAVKIVSVLSSSVFGVYLLHIGHFRGCLFLIWLNDKTWYETPLFILHLLVSMLVIFAVGVLVDKFRIYVIERPVLSVLDEPIKRLDKKVSSLYPNPEVE